LASAALLLLTAAGLPEPLEGLQGDPVRGRTVVARQSSTCILCHAGPFPNPHLQGNIGPDLHGVGARLTPAEIRAQIVDARRVNPDSPMPSFWGTDGRIRVGPAWQSRPILQAQEIEDTVAYLSTLRDPAPAQDAAPSAKALRPENAMPLQDATPPPVTMAPRDTMSLPDATPPRGVARLPIMVPATDAALRHDALAPQDAAP